MKIEVTKEWCVNMANLEAEADKDAPAVPERPISRLEPFTPTQARWVAQVLQDAAEDPMWAEHAEVSKATLVAAASALWFMSSQVETLAALMLKPKPLVEIGRCTTPCGECHLQPGERCDICGALQSA
jgi:hypothetical protein